MGNIEHREPWSCPYCGTPYGEGNEIRDDCCAGAELSALKMEHVDLRDQLKGAVEALARYGDHDRSCATRLAGPCQCGFDDALAAVRGR